MLRRDALAELRVRAFSPWVLFPSQGSLRVRMTWTSRLSRHRTGLIHHTERGSTCAAGEYRKALDNYEMVASMSAKGDYLDNAVAESTSATSRPETEALGDHLPVDIDELRRTLFPYIEGFYNERRLHFPLDCKTPAKKERDVLDASHAA